MNTLAAGVASSDLAGAFIERLEQTYRFAVWERH
jgi:hypothetical protein